MSSTEITERDMRMVFTMRELGDELAHLEVVRSLHTELRARRGALIESGSTEIETDAIISGALRRALSRLDEIKKEGSIDQKDSQAQTPA